MVDDEYEEEGAVRDVIPKALRAAVEEFNHVLCDVYGYDPAMCDVRFTVWLKDINLITRLARFEIEEELGGENEK